MKPSLPERIPKRPLKLVAAMLMIAGFALLAASVHAQSSPVQSSPVQSPPAAQNLPSRTLDVPYVPTPQPVVDRMLELARVNKGDMVYDLGCGDGRIVITAAKRFGAQGVGIDLNPQRIEEAKANARTAGVENQVRFTVGDLYKTDFSKADVVTLYLLSTINKKLRPQLWKQLKVGTRVVSHAFDMGPEWPPEKMEVVNGSAIYVWTITQANKNAVAIK